MLAVREDASRARAFPVGVVSRRGQCNSETRQPRGMLCGGGLVAISLHCALSGRRSNSLVGGLGCPASHRVLTRGLEGDGFDVSVSVSASVSFPPSRLPPAVSRLQDMQW